MPLPANVLSQILKKSVSVKPQRKTWNPRNPQPLLPRRTTNRQERDIRFVDRCRVRVRAGKGGNGICCFSGIAFKEYAGPDGGNGGNGGDVIFKASKKMATLEQIEAEYKAHNGNLGQSFCKTGKRGADKIITVPTNIRIRLVTDGNETDKQCKVTDLITDKQKFIAAFGGIGGRGNFAFLTNTDRAPEVWEPGLPGEDKVYDVEMLKLANFALVGMPNTGKSSFLRAVSRAKPRIAEYPFTTLFPQIGVVDFEDSVRISIAEIPGLICGASNNVGNGIVCLLQALVSSFLTILAPKHADACTCLVLMLNLEDQFPYNQLQVIREEINHFNPDMLNGNKPIIIVGNKIECYGAKERWSEFKEHLTESPWASQLLNVAISVNERINITKLLITMRRVLSEYERKDLERLKEDGFIL
ncbi:hypothetical protein ACOME3_005295 [Neoechinorhynchus agilis]